MRKVSLGKAATFAAMFGFATAASAATTIDVPPASFYANIHGTEISSPGSISTPDGSASITYNDGAPSLNLRITTSDDNSIGGSAQISYYFMISGPATTDVPVDITASASLYGAATSGSVEENATISVNGQFVNEACLYMNVSSCLSTPSQFSGTWPLGTFATGSMNRLQYTLTGNLYPNWDGSVSATESLDPDVSIDPAWLANHPGYALVFSPGAIPEPTAWAMLIMGMGMIGLATRRRREGATQSA